MGTVWVNDSDYSYSEPYAGDPNYRDEGELSFDTGFVLNAAFGYAYDNGFRAELEYGFRANDLDKAGPINGHLFLQVPTNVLRGSPEPSRCPGPTGL